MGVDEIHPTVIVPKNEHNNAQNKSDATTENNTTKESGHAEEVQQARNKETTKKQAKNSISITRALIVFGYESWLALEPGEYELVMD